MVGSPVAGHASPDATEQDATEQDARYGYRYGLGHMTVDTFGKKFLPTL